MNNLIDNSHVKINHQMADTISISKGDRAYCGKNSSEIAFFQCDDWQVVPIPEFAIYHDGSDADTAVYPYVPNELVDSFLEKFGV